MVPSQTFEHLNACAGLAHAFLLRQPRIATEVERETALARLDPGYTEAVEAMGFSSTALRRAEQIHGNQVAVVTEVDEAHLPEVDGLITQSPEILLGILVADCCAVYLVDPVNGAIGLLHSGRKGTELGITSVAIDRMTATFGSRPQDLIVQLSPCIRPPCYEVDIASAIRAQALEAGVPESQVHDVGTCTACDLTRYYSYRAEKGKTGRMLALLGMRAPIS